MATGAIYYDADGKEQFQPAEMVIVACNGVGTPRLLLNSAVGALPQRPRQLERPGRQEPDVPPLRRMTYGYVDEPLDGNRGPPLCLWSQEFYETDPARDFVRGYTLQFDRGTGPVVEAITSTAAGRLPWGEDHHDVYRAAARPLASASSAICEDLPEEHNRVTLDPVLKDSNGIPAPQDRLHDEREHAAHDGPRHRPRRRRS